LIENAKDGIEHARDDSTLIKHVKDGVRVIELANDVVRLK